jgi:serine O-acetyltransferase
MSLFIKFFISRSIRIIILIRLLKYNTKIISFLCSRILRRKCIEVSKASKIGTGVFFPHPWCIIVAGGVIIGDNVSIGQYVTIGGNFKKIRKNPDGSIQKLPIIGNRVMIHPGAVIGGPVIIGDDVIIGANSVVTRDVPSNSIVYGQNTLAKKKIKIPETGGEFTIL